MGKTVRYKVELRNLPLLTDAQKAEIEAPAAMPEDQIDTSDISLLDDAFWKSAIRNPFYKPTKTATTVQVDSDVLACAWQGHPLKLGASHCYGHRQCPPRSRAGSE